MEGTAQETGERFFHALVKNLSIATGWRDAWITEYLPESVSLRTLAYWSNDEILANEEYALDGTPCEPVILEQRLLHIPTGVQAAFPRDTDLGAIFADSYLGLPMVDRDGEVLGHLAMTHDSAKPEEPRGLAIFKIFAARAAAELRRMRSDSKRRDSEQQLSAVFNCALDAIVTVDNNLNIVLVNAAASRMFKCSQGELNEHGLSEHLFGDDAQRLKRLIVEMQSDAHDDAYLYVPGTLTARCSEGNTFPTEVTVSACQLGGTTFFTVILRDVNARLEAEKQIKVLANHRQYLEDELKALHNFDEIVGSSPVLLSALDDVRQVAGTDTTVLIYGETGTGKELFARAIHNASGPARASLWLRLTVRQFPSR